MVTLTYTFVLILRLVWDTCTLQIHKCWYISSVRHKFEIWWSEHTLDSSVKMLRFSGCSHLFVLEMQILKEKKWKEVTAVFNFPSSATNASFILRKYYVSLLYHYEQIYFFKAKCWSPAPTGELRSLRYYVKYFPFLLILTSVHLPQMLCKLCLRSHLLPLDSMSMCLQCRNERMLLHHYLKQKLKHWSLKVLISS